MAVRIRNLRVGVDEPEAGLAEHAARLLGVPVELVERWRILRKSLDARDKSDLAFVYSLEVALPIDEARRALAASPKRRAEIDWHEEPSFVVPNPGDHPLAERPVIIGAGPAGMFAAYLLAERGYRPLVLERGQMVNRRIEDVQSFDAGGPHNPESNYLFGEGGAGTFSDGKLTCRNSGPDVQRVLQILAECKGKPSILYDHRPHLGSNRLPAVVKALRQRVESLGGEFRFECRVEDLDIDCGRLRGLGTSSGYMKVNAAVLAIGHSARDTYEMLLARGVPFVPKPFQFGVRIEQPQEQVNRYQYGTAPLEERLGSADYSVVARGPQPLFSFCMCAGGYVMPSVSEPGFFSTNGMSLSKRNSQYANSGMMLTIEPSMFGSNHPLAGVALQREFERRAFEIGRGEYACPIQRVDDFLRRRATRAAPPSSYPRAVVCASIEELAPGFVIDSLRRGLPAIDGRWRGLFLKNATLVGPEARGSAPVRFLRNESTLESPGVAGLYPIGEGAGYAGGIVSAALDGLRVAKSLIARFAPLERR